jgi:hypothetical protein
LGALEGVTSALSAAGTGIVGAMASPLTGAAGNVEFLVHARKDVIDTLDVPDAPVVPDVSDVPDLLAGALAEAEALVAVGGNAAG